MRNEARPNGKSYKEKKIMNAFQLHWKVLKNKTMFFSSKVLTVKNVCSFNMDDIHFYRFLTTNF